MTQSQSREYDSYYTLTDLTGLYTDLNELKSLEGKEENYSEEEDYQEVSPLRKAILQEWYKNVCKELIDGKEIKS